MNDPRFSTRRRVIIPVIFVWLAAACASGGALAKKVAGVQPGETKASLMQRLGAPGNRQFQGDDEALQYCEQSTAAYMSDAPAQYTVVWLHAGKVTGVTSYSGQRAGRCTGGYQTVRWEDAPRRPGDASDTRRPPSVDSVGILRKAADLGDGRSTVQFGVHVRDG